MMFLIAFMFRSDIVLRFLHPSKQPWDIVVAVIFFIVVVFYLLLLPFWSHMAQMLLFLFQILKLLLWIFCICFSFCSSLTTNKSIKAPSELANYKKHEYFIWVILVIYKIFPLPTKLESVFPSVHDDVTFFLWIGCLWLFLPSPPP